jgi:hypothetical protein
MAHYAFLNSDNVITEIIVGKDETDTSQDWEQFYGEIRNQVCKRTSYNNNIRKNYAGIGYTYDAERDAFIPPKPYASWILDETTCQWTSSTPYPNDGNRYWWNEEKMSWELIE